MNKERIETGKLNTINMEEKIDIIESLVKDRASKVVGRHNYFSVMILLVNIDGELHVLYEVRSPRLANQPNEVSFPGGKIEKGETPKEAALRETFEEIGVSESDIRLLGKGDRVIAISDFTVYSYIGYIEEETFHNIKLNPAEVAEVFLVPLDFLKKEPEVHIFDVKQHSRDDFPFHLVKVEPSYEFYSSKIEIPIYSYEDKAIWGLTGRLTRAFINILKDGNII